MFDICGSVLGLVFLSPLLLMVAVAVRIDSAGPVFFRQTRIGQGGQPFRIWKFRTMMHSAEVKGPGATVGGEAKITRVGAILRRNKVDELPQLINVACGTMSIVGPRPETPMYVEMYSDEERQVLSYRPGITDPAAIDFRNEEALLASIEAPEQYYQQVVMPEKLALSLGYARSASLLSDVVIIFRTLASIFKA